eukprot:7633127-Pyramimonas_sp.AAC.2
MEASKAQANPNSSTSVLSVFGKGHVARTTPATTEEPPVGVTVPVSWNKGNGPIFRIGVRVVERRVCVIV